MKPIYTFTETVQRSPVDPNLILDCKTAIQNAWEKFEQEQFALALELGDEHEIHAQATCARPKGRAVLPVDMSVPDKVDIIAIARWVAKELGLPSIQG